MARPYSRNPWTPEEDAEVMACDTYDEFARLRPHRSHPSWNSRRRQLKKAERIITAPPPEFVSDKKYGEFNWREANTVMQSMIEMKRKASFSQDEANIFIDTDKPIAVLSLSDTHIGSWSTDHSLLERITDEILNTPNLYVALLGDLEQMAIKASHGVLSLADNLLPPELQHRYIESWLEEIEHRVLWSTWDNHAVEREEKGTGFSGYADIMKRKVIWHNGIGHPNVAVGDQCYTFCVSHRFRFRTYMNPVHGGMQYIRTEAPDREISIAGDSHVPGITHWWLGDQPKLSMNCGSYQTNSGYAKRFFSLATSTVMPVVVLYPDQHKFVGLPSVADWMALA